MDAALLDEIIERLEAAVGLSEGAKEIVLATLLGDLDAHLAGAAAARPDVTPVAASEPEEAFLAAIEAEGFRGIGEACRLSLVAGPGLTLVVGRNGSGKSSLAEAAELLLTERNERWAGRSKDWTAGWRNLHRPEPARIAVELQVAGVRGAVRVERLWAAGEDDVEGGRTRVQRPGEPQGDLDSLGWRSAIGTWRPFLSYSELGSLLASPSVLHDALSAILGLGAVERGVDEVAAARKRLADAGKAATKEAEFLRNDLERLEDERAVAGLAALPARLSAKKRWDLDAIERLTIGGDTAASEEQRALVALQGLVGPAGERCAAAAAEIDDAAAGFAATLSSAEGSEAERANETAELLRRALDHCGDGARVDCPVCGSEAVLDAEWRERSRRRIGELEAQATRFRAARQRLDAALAAGRGLLGAPSPALLQATTLGLDAAPVVAAWDEWLRLPSNPAEFGRHLVEVGERLRAATLELARRAGERIDERERFWRPVAARLAAWLPAARQAEAAMTRVADLKAAEDWLKAAALELRNLRFEPIKDEVRQVFGELSSHGNVGLADVLFAGKANLRKVELEVQVDGTPGVALGVMSQGELHALALALFLPRAMRRESPFRFVVIDDPVQSMDPARVDGLARVLDRAARSRQVVVFTHDDRLPQALRLLGIGATVIEVTRRPGSRVEVRPVDDPVRRQFDDAVALAKSPEVPKAARERVIPGICRVGIELACLERVRRTRLGRGEAHADVEALLDSATSLRHKLVLALCDDLVRLRDLDALLDTKVGTWAKAVVHRCNRGAHEGDDVDLQFVRDAQTIAERVRG